MVNITQTLKFPEMRKRQYRYFKKSHQTSPSEPERATRKKNKPTHDIFYKSWFQGIPLNLRTQIGKAKTHPIAASGESKKKYKRGS